jgi:uncharacterized membrane protein YphA (DoxX/SURF4 family)
MKRSSELSDIESDKWEAAEEARRARRKRDLLLLVINLAIILLILFAATFILSGWQAVTNLALGLVALALLGIRVWLSIVGTRDFLRGE